jgi:hypothetical protein
MAVYVIVPGETVVARHPTLYRCRFFCGFVVSRSSGSLQICVVMGVDRQSMEQHTCRLRNCRSHVYSLAFVCELRPFLVELNVVEKNGRIQTEDRLE